MKTVLITGTSSGIGKATAQRFAKHGWNVAATMRRPEGHFEETETLRSYALDVTDGNAVTDVVTRVIKDFGSLNVLINNAGYGLAGPFEEASEAQIKQQFDTNLFGAFAVTRAAIPQMRTQGSGVIINITSIGGLVSFPFNSLYHATKFALDGFSASLAYELEPFGIRVKIVAPGSVRTDFAGRSLQFTSTDPDNIYAPAVANLFAAFSKRSAGHGSDAMQIAEVIFEAATDGSRQIRYVAGEDAQEVWKAKGTLSEQEFYEKVAQDWGQRSTN